MRGLRDEHQGGRGNGENSDPGRSPPIHPFTERVGMVAGKKLDVGAILRAADAGGFAVPAFNYSDIWDFLAIVEAAEELEAPIFISSNQLVVTDIGIELCRAFGAAATVKARIPLIHHLDHSTKPDICRSAVNHGYHSRDDRRLIKVVGGEHRDGGGRHRVHPPARRVRGGRGRPDQGHGNEGKFTGQDFLARVEDVVKFVKETGVDSPAVGIGSAQGFYEGKPKIHFDRLEEINAAVKIPLVLHGGTGIPEEDVRRAIRGGINKVNVGTIIRCTYMNVVRAELNARGENPYTLDVMKPVRAAIEEVVKSWIKVCMADGKGGL